MGISRDSFHKRRATGGKLKPWRKARKYVFILSSRACACINFATLFLKFERVPGFSRTPQNDDDVIFKSCCLNTRARDTHK